MSEVPELSTIMLGRTLGHLPVSIATSLAFEVACGTGTAPEEKPTTVNQLRKYEAIWINVRTIARNIFNSVEASQKNDIVVNDIVAALDQEVDSLRQAVPPIAGNQPLVFYVSHNKNIDKKMRHADFRAATTEKQKHQHDVTHGGVERWLKLVRWREKEGEQTHGKDYVSPVKEFDFSVKTKERQTVVMLTHHMVDLLYHDKFKRLTLLESHTGALKDKDRWYTKFVGGREMAFMPFNAATLQLFGDTEVFKPYKSIVRDEIVAIGKERRWNPSTSDEQFLNGVRASRNKFLIDTIRDMIHVVS